MWKTIILVLLGLLCLALTAYIAVSLYIKIYNWLHAKQKKKPEFSKLIFAFAATVNIVVIIYSLVMMAITLDLSPLAYIIPATAADMATATGFYYNKAKAENEIKLKKEYGIPLSDDDFDGDAE